MKEINTFILLFLNENFFEFDKRFFIVYSCPSFRKTIIAYTLHLLYHYRTKTCTQSEDAFTIACTKPLSKSSYLFLLINYLLLSVYTAYTAPLAVSSIIYYYLNLLFFFLQDIRKAWMRTRFLVFWAQNHFIIDDSRFYSEQRCECCFV